MFAAVLDARANFCKKYPHLPRSNREWPRVVATEIMQLSGGNTFANLGLLKKTCGRDHPGPVSVTPGEGVGIFSGIVSFSI